ncbi:hypothetical protein E4T66_06700 [Sinimarinibacterium sp. CAU 1509]|uniref:hypothetical protein n=1 Tax=Sinimarinibacterium sp. CAU 1509 TaxID=2562283 RepID=UPI0010AD2E81|nr:hypothetical protein [Sinimarinibacterium sp. CAU 1509]TJY61930.1 hypothetical protein E4T66_06700 [Sinimarinibacterium sp. CAU 1509]
MRSVQVSGWGGLGVIACLLAGIAGCDNGGSAAMSEPQVRAADLCVSSECGERTVLLDIPSAENLLFSDDGRLFVSSGEGVLEIKQAGDGSYSTHPISPDCGSALGLAIRHGVLYAVCSGQRLFAGKLTAEPVLQQVFEFVGMCIPNGMTDGPDGNLYVVDEPLNACVPDPKIVRLNVDPEDPLHILGQETWLQGSPLGQLALGLDNVLRFPNGLQRSGNRFYGTDGGSVYAVDWLPGGGADDVIPLYFTVTAHDDLGIVSDGLLVADFLEGRIVLLSREGELLQQTDRLLFSFPSSVRLGRPPMFAPDDVVVTETGVLTDNSLPLDHLSVFRRKAGH